MVAAIANARQRARARNHSAPTPGVIFVSSGKAQTAGARSPTTSAAASSRWTLPTHSSYPIGRMSIGTAHGHGRTSQASSATDTAVQPAKNAQNGIAENGARSCANAGEYR